MTNKEMESSPRTSTTSSGQGQENRVCEHCHPKCTPVSSRRQYSMSLDYRFYLTLLTFVLLGISKVSANDLVYVRSNSFEQLITSSTMRWMRESAGKEAVTLGGDSTGHTICRVSHAGLKEVGLLSVDKNSCNVNPHDDSASVTSSSKYQTLTSSAARLIWVNWTTPNPPPPGAIAVSEKPSRFLATDVNHSMVGYLDPKAGNGALIFPKDPNSQPKLSGLVLQEIEPERYELFDVELTRERGFLEEEVILTQGHLTYDLPPSKYEREDEHDHLPGGVTASGSEESMYEDQELTARHHRDHRDHAQNGHSQEPIKGRIESVLSYDISEYDNWGSGPLMAKGLPTLINLPRGWTPKQKSVEWGLPFTKTRNGETVTASAELLSGTAVNMTLRGTKLSGELLYWATLRTFYKDGSSATRYIGGSRKLIQITNIRLEYGRPYFTNNGTYVPEPTTTTTSTTTTTTTTTSTTSRSTTSSTSLPKSNKSRASEGNEKEKMLGDQHSSETLTYSASSKLSGSGVGVVVGRSFNVLTLITTFLSIRTYFQIYH